MLDMGSVSINGTSQIEGKAVVYFSASYNGSQANSFSSAKSVSDVEAYLANRQQCDADYAEFDATAMDMIQRLSHEKGEDQK